MTFVSDSTTAKERESGFRSLLAIREDRDSRTVVAVTVHRAENIALPGDAPCFISLPGETAPNVPLAELLAGVVAALLKRPHLDRLPVEMALSPAGSATVPSPVNCHED